MSTPATSDENASHLTDSVASGRVSKNPKACEECRRRKQRCDGKTPCSLCAKRSSTCFYRSYIRHRARRGSQVNQPLSTRLSQGGSPEERPAIVDLASNNSCGDRPQDGLPRSMPDRLAIFNNIRATQDTPRGKTELFYGASSPFSVLQHLDAHLPMQGAPAVYPDRTNVDVQNGDKSIRSYNYQNLVFDHLSDPVVQACVFDSRSYSSAQIAMRNFLTTACPRLPFLVTNKFCASFEKLYSEVEGPTLPTADRALVIAALGLGASQLINLPHKQLFLAQARAEAANIVYDINTKTVQATLVLAMFEFEVGSPNICYLHLGGAIRKAFAAGVHRSGTEEARQTMRALYCFESLTCFILGKHPSLTETDLPSPQTQDQSHVDYFARLCTIIRSAHRLYHLDDTVMADLTAAEAVNQQLRDFSLTLKATTRIEIGGPVYALTGDELAWHITFSYVFNVTKLLLYRPFLLLCLELKRRGVRDIRSERNGGVEMRVLYEAAARSVSSAQDIITFCDSLFSLHIGNEGVYSHGFYLESACFVLALAAVHQSDQLPSNCFEKLQTGLRLLRQLGFHEPVRSVSAAVEQMINRICALTGRPVPAGEGSVSDQQPLLVSDNVSSLATQPSTASAPLLALDPLQDTLTPDGWDHDLSLNDLWSMMDWNVGFPSMDPTSTTLPEL